MKMIVNFKIEDHLTEQILGDVLRASPCITNVRPQFRIAELGIICDYYCEINEVPTLVEFDGHLHYTDFKTIKRDLRLQEFCYRTTNPYHLVQIPYFVQLKNSTLDYYFGDIGMDIECEYPHGFIKSKIYPSYFHVDGYRRFLTEMQGLNTIDGNEEVSYLNRVNDLKIDNVPSEIWQSLKDKNLPWEDVDLSLRIFSEEELCEVYGPFVWG